MVISIRVVHFAALVLYGEKRTLSIMGHWNARFSKSCWEQLKSPVLR